MSERFATLKCEFEFGSGGSHDQADAEWIVIWTQLRGHNDTHFGWPSPVGPLAARGLAALQATFVCFNYY
jgi:hypothetical protein